MRSDDNFLMEICGGLYIAADKDDKSFYHKIVKFATYFKNKILIASSNLKKFYNDLLIKIILSIL